MNSNTNEPETSGHNEIRNPDITYESQDLSARAVLGFLLTLALAGIILQVALWGVFKYLAGPEKSQGQISRAPTRTTNPIMTSNRELRSVGGDPAVMFPNPRLQPDPVADLNKFRVREEEILNSYGWVDQASGKVHIPIEQAIQMVAKTGLPTRSPGTAPPAAAPNGAPGAAGRVNAKAGASKAPAEQQ